jgi:hypothetical protein
MNVPTGIGGQAGADLRGRRITDVEVDWDRFLQPLRSFEDVLIDVSTLRAIPGSEPSEQRDRPHR